MQGCFVTGTDTGAGKTVLAAAIVAALRTSGVAVRALKPVMTGLDAPSSTAWPPDHELLAAVAGCRPDEVVLSTYGPAVSPHLAAQLAGRALSLAELCAGVRGAAGAGEVLVVEGVGGLLVPLDAHCDVRDLARELGLALIVAARPGLGTINHTLLTLEAARAAGLPVAAVVLTPWPDEPGVVERSNLETIANRGRVEVGTLGYVARADRESLAAAASSLPLQRWLN